VTAEGNIETPGQPSLHYRVLGHGSDTAIVLHGGPGLHMRYLLDPLARVADHHTMIFYDLRGRGESGDVGDSTQLSLEKDLEDVARVQQHFKLGKLKLVGHHWGAAVAAMFAAAHPDQVDRMLLVSPYPVHRAFLYQLSFVRGDSVLWDEAMKHVATAKTPSEALAFCRSYWPVYFSPLAPHVKTPYAQLASSVCDVRGERLLEFDRTRRWAEHGVGVNPWRESLNRTDVPALVIEGRGDTLVTEAAIRWAQHLPRGEVLMLDEPYLEPWVGDPKRFALSVDRFLAGHMPSGAIKPPPFGAVATAAR
jgi:pimeloyl-ACP methyl ester carboxylesterase